MQNSNKYSASLFLERQTLMIVVLNDDEWIPVDSEHDWNIVEIFLWMEYRLLLKPFTIIYTAILRFQEFTDKIHL